MMGVKPIAVTPPQWLARYVDRDDGHEKKRRRTSRLAAEFAFLTHAGPQSIHQAATMSLQGLAEWYGWHQPRRKVRQSADQVALLRRTFQADLPNLAMGEITTAHLAQLRADLCRTRAPGGADAVMRLVKRTFRMATDAGLLEENPAAALGAPAAARIPSRRGVGPRNRRAAREPGAAELAILRHAAPEWLLAGINLLTDSGLDGAESNALPRQAIDLANRQIRFDFYHPGLENLFETRSTRGPIPISDRLAASLIRLEVLKRGKTAYPPERDRFVLPFQITGDTIGRLFRAHQGAGRHPPVGRSGKVSKYIGPPFEVDDLQNVAVIGWINKAVSLKEIARRLGLKSVKSLVRKFRKYRDRVDNHRHIGKVNAVMEKLLHG
jgi:hypothetical protein